MQLIDTLTQYYAIKCNNLHLSSEICEKRFSWDYPSHQPLIISEQEIKAKMPRQQTFFQGRVCCFSNYV